MRRLPECFAVVVPLTLLLMVGRAEAVTICIGPCEPSVVPLPTLIVVDPLDLLDFPTTDVSGLVLDGGDALGPYNVAGDVVVHVPSDSLVADVIDLRSGVGEIEFQLSLIMADTITFCTLECVPFETETPGFVGDPFHLVILGPLTGTLAIFASGNLFVTNEPIPEPTTALLMALGVAAFATGRPRPTARRSD